MTEEAKKMHEAGARIAELKMKKSRCKALFTRAKNRLINAINDEETSEELFTELIDKLETAMDESTRSIENLCQEYKHQEKTNDMLSTLSEIEDIGKEYDKVMKSYHESQRDNESEQSGKSNNEIGKDLWKQLKRVSLPIFDGEIRNYEPWKSAFMACVDSAPATKEYKLLQLRQYLKGAALKAIEDLRHSGLAYDAAKQRLERKYRGERRKVGKYMEDIERFPVMNVRNAKSLDKFADLLDIAVINIREAGLDSELGTGMMYLTLQKKLPEQMLTSYHRWMIENEEKESVETLREYVCKEAEYHVIAQETKQGIGSSGTYSAKKPSWREPHSYYTTTGRTRPTRLCKICTGRHHVWQCDKFKALPVQDRWTKAKEAQLCFRCLKDNHKGIDCRNYRKCGVNNCQKTHDSLLHVDPPLEKKMLNPMATPYQPENVTGHSKSRTDSSTNSYIALRTMLIIKSKGKCVRVNALLDDGSTKTYINADIAAELGLQGEMKQVTVNVLDGQINTFQTKPVTFEVHSVDSNVLFEVNAFTTNRVTGNMEVIDWSKQSKMFPHLSEIKFRAVSSSRPIVDILIGLDHPDIHQSIKEVYGRPGEPYARLSPLGWTCIGKPFGAQEEDQAFMTYFLQDDLGCMLKNFWEIEDVPFQKSHSTLLAPKDRQILAETEQSMTYKNDRYEVGIPWIRKPTVNNYDMAKSRLERTENKLNKTPEIKEMYSQTIKKYEEKGYITKVNTEEIEQNMRWYLPHFPVVRLDRDTTKVRIVFDASAKCENKSLNDCIYEGPKLQNELFDVLLRFRKHPVAIVCDISEMYLQIGLKPEDRSFHSFLWNSEAKPIPDVFEFNRVVFGVNASPYLAMFVARKNAEKYQSVYPLAAETVLKSTYMDGSMDSVLNDELGIQMYLELSALWKKAGMFAKKWLSNSTKVIQSVPPEDRTSEIDLESGSLPAKKTLGVLWKSGADILSFKSNSEIFSDKCTKRFVLKVIARLFDPLGLLSPFIVQGKILMQKLWCDGYDWDAVICEKLRREIEHWFNGLSELNDIEVERSLNYSEDVQSSALHVFVDASELAYAVTIYVRHEMKDSSTDIRFVCSKTKVAPLKAMSIPRLELMAAVLGVRLAYNVVRALQTEMCDVVFWSDSMNVLWWIHRESRIFKPFVANRVSDIHDKSVPNQWRYVPSNEKPADIASRGMTANELVTLKCGGKGRSFLREYQNYGQKNEIEEKKESRVEIRAQKLQKGDLDTFFVIDSNQEVIDIEKYSSWYKLVRVLAWVLRFISNCTHTRDSRRQEELQADEIIEAETMLIRKAQFESYPDEFKCLTKKIELPKRNKLVQLNPKLDNDGVLRCDTRLKFAKFLSYDTRYPIILPCKSRITKLIVKQHHEMNFHAGTNQVLASLSTKYWIEAAREVIRECEKTDIAIVFSRTL